MYCINTVEYPSAMKGNYCAQNMSESHKLYAEQKKTDTKINSI